MTDRHRYYSLNPLKIWREFSVTLIFCTLIAFFLVFIGVARPLSATFAMSFSIGLSIHLFIRIGMRAVKPAGNGGIWIIIILGSIVGAVIGINLGPFLSQVLFNEPVDFDSPNVLQVALFALAFGSVISYFFWSRHSLTATQARVQEETIKRIRSENAAMEANLRLLQAQIEPHFLFNTLSTIHSLMDTEPRTAKAMLMDLNQYLRTTLRQTREDDSTLGREVDVVVAYLKIFKIRMGGRLQFSVDLPEALKHTAFPPMLLQPLVENAVIHGIEPAEEGGRIDIRVEHPPGTLRVEIADTGAGFADSAGNGIGLANVRKRLGLLFGNRGRLIIRANQPHGVMVTVEVADEESR